MQLSDYAEKYTSIRFERDEAGVLIMTMHTRGGPAKWGTTTKSLHCELGHAFADVARDPDNRVVILTGTGDIFITELDMDDMANEPDLARMWMRIHQEGLALLNNLLDIPVPMIAAVNGNAFIHSELAVLCDIVLAADHAEFADLAHVVGGSVPGDGVHVIWPMLLGPNRGRYFLLTGEKIGAAEAKSLGIVGEVVSPADLMPRAKEHAARLAALPPAMMRHTRTLLVHNLRQRMRDELASGLAHEGLAILYSTGA